MARDRHEMRDVVLVDVDDDRAGPGAGGGAGAGAELGPGPGTGPHAVPMPWRRRVPVRRLGAAAVVAAVVVTAGVLDARGEAADLARVAALPGALAPVDGPIGELWRTSDLFVSGLARVGDLLVGTGQHDGATVDAVGLDADTGTVVWTTPLSRGGDAGGGASCVTPGPAAAPKAGDGVVVGTASGRVTVCVVVEEVGPVDDFSPAGVVEPTAARMVVLDPGTGRVMADAPTAPSTTLAPLGSDLVTGRLDDDGRLVVRRTDPFGRAVRWTFTSPEPLVATEYGRWAWVTVLDDLLLAGGDAGWVLSTDGEPLHSWEPSPSGPGWVDVVGPGLMVEPGPGGGLTSRVVDLRESTAFTVAGRPVPTAVDDGSAGDVLLAQTAGNRLAAVAVGTGRPLWSVPDAGSGGAGLLVVDGRVVRARDGGLQALDATTGTELWNVDTVAPAQYELMTDGRLVVCVVQHPDRGRVLTAYDLDDGRLRWEADLPPGVDWLFVQDGALFGYAQNGLVALG